MARILQLNSTQLNSTQQITPVLTVLNQTAFLAAMQKGRFCFAVEIKGKYVGGKGTVVPFFKSGLIFQMRC